MEALNENSTTYGVIESCQLVGDVRMQALQRQRVGLTSQPGISARGCGRLLAAGRCLSRTSGTEARVSCKQFSAQRGIRD